MDLALWLLAPYTAATVGGLVAGWLSGYLVKRGWPTGRARLTVMLGCALGMPAAIGAVLAHDAVTALVLISIATGCHQAWGANLFTIPSDMFPKRAVGSVVGLGSSGGAIGGLFMTLIAGGILQWTGSFVPLFCITGSCTSSPGARSSSWPAGNSSPPTSITIRRCIPARCWPSPARPWPSWGRC
jgi:ACS family hexuronate transporter-like MFS transporter